LRTADVTGGKPHLYRMSQVLVLIFSGLLQHPWRKKRTCYSFFLSPTPHGSFFDSLILSTYSDSESPLYQMGYTLGSPVPRVPYKVHGTVNVLRKINIRLAFVITVNPYT
jgi:hypothetical protein